MTLSKRIDRLEGKLGTAAPGPSVIFFCSGITGEPLVAILMGGGSLTREDGETAKAFTARAEAGAAAAVFLPDNGRDALATGKAPNWGAGEKSAARKARPEANRPKL